jgi:hypothetical protein
MRTFLSALFILAAPLAGCTHHLNHAQTTPASKASGDAVAVSAASCWLGGLWSDALGEKKVAWSDTRTPGIESRCKAVLDGNGMRAIDPNAVEAIARKLDNDSQRALLREIANAARENANARRVADRVKADYADDTTTKTERTNDKLFAGPVLRKSDGLLTLFHDSGPYATDAHAVALLLSIDRVEIARGLPKHLKIDVLDAPCREVFGVATPQLPRDDSAPLPTGTWLSYLSVVASAAGHPIPEGASSDPAHREPLAWNGVLKGFADKLRGLEPRIIDTARLAPVTSAVVTRLDSQYDVERSVAMSYAPKKRGG